jgi:hypothetical protein
MRGPRIAVFALALLVSGCSRALGVDIVGTVSDSAISGYIRSGFLDLARTQVRARAVEVRDWTFLADHPRALQPQPTMWLVQGTCDGAPEIVRYGHTPAGFIESTPAHTLTEGRTYMVSVDGCEPGYISGVMTFRILSGRIVKIDWH